jgi:hypothetical protein
MHVFELGKPGVAIGAEQELIGKLFELLKVADAGQQGPLPSLRIAIPELA